MTSFNERYAKEEKDHYQYIKHRNGKWVILQKGTGKVLSHHDTREKAIAAFKAMMVSKHGAPERARTTYYELPETITQVPDNEKLKECGRCGIDIARFPGKSLTFNTKWKSVCPDCKDVLNARDTVEANVKLDSSDWRNEYLNLDADW
jgi:hypothetical protein